VAARPHRGHERGKCPCEPVPDERRAEAERDVERLGLERIGGGVALDDLDAPVEPGHRDALARRFATRAGALTGPSSAIFSGLVGFWSSWSRSATA
jgi:hypothetical protein